MKRLFKFVTIFFVMVTCLMPLLECFDRWDAPGLANDAEFPVFLITLFVTLALLAVFAMARRLLDDRHQITASKIRYEVVWKIFRPAEQLIFDRLMIPPLRI